MKTYRSLLLRAAIAGLTLMAFSCDQREGAISVDMDDSESRLSTYSPAEASGLCDLPGRMVFHAYTDYGAWDGKLYLYDFANHTLTEISAGWGIDHTINAHFSPDGAKLVFMGVPGGSHNFNSWDIYLWTIGSPAPANLTAGNGLRDEDPKFSPLGNEIVFKQDGDLKIMNLSGTVTRALTNDGWASEESMPYFTTDGQKIIYSKGAGSSSSLMLINRDGTGRTKLVNAKNVQEYYPVARDASTYLYTRWKSASNHHDQVYLGCFASNCAHSLPFNRSAADNADPCPVGTPYVIFSSNRSGGRGGWDLYLGDINTGATCSFSSFGINTSRDELGATYTAVRP